ncbi:MAG: radical SAM protein [Candidatus Kerfeldbacteria bacterium]|nr:radical SAM protein [Candidatus Kerfeldbacteria bacterium]
MNITDSIRYPVDAVIGVTYNCNSRCVMCDIWKMDPHEQMQLSDFAKIPTTLKDVNISGGEPFLHKQIVEIVKTVRSRVPHARIVISSNGFSTKLIEQRITEILKYVPDIRIGISIDGLEEMHDKIRGIPNGFQKCMATVDMLKRVGVKNIRLAFTVTTDNVEHLPKVYELARSKGVEFTCAFAQSSDFYFGAKQNYEHPDPVLLKKGFLHIIRRELRSLSPKRWVRAFFAHGLYRFATTTHQPLSSRPGTDFFYLDPNGHVYPSVVHYHKMGDIKTAQTFEDVWFSEEAQAARAKVEANEKQYWMICTARSAIRRHPLTVAVWFIKSQFNTTHLLD